MYRSGDGGKTWRQVLWVDENTGCSDMDIDPQDPRWVWAGMWDFRRLPWTFRSGGPGSGLYRSADGGKTWQRLERGLPEGELGRIAVAVAPSRPNVVYANIEAEKTALYRSDDLGQTWREVNSSFLIQARPFYFSALAVDPTDHDRVYRPSFSLGVSSDGGRSFNSPLSSGFSFGSIHPDHHAIWIDPQDPRFLVLGTDGGVYISHDRGRHWRHVGTLPISQFYRVAYDMEFPYNVYGGLQDNGSWRGPSRRGSGIRAADWEVVGWGDGFWTLPDPDDPAIVYSEYQGGNLQRLDRRTGEMKDIRPYPREGEPELRFNWNTPLYMSRASGATLYYGAQFLYRSRDRGDSWERISPDLTTDDPEKQRQEESGGLTADNTTAENHCTIYTISDSPLDGNVIWVGTDDGNLQVTRDGGRTWTNVVENIPDLPPNTWVSMVEASRHAKGRAWVTFDGHRLGDMTPWVFVTEDFGATWKRRGEGQVHGWAHVIREDFVDERLLFLGTERGLFVSLDGGESWVHFRQNLPPVSVRDIAIHPREADVILATHGRGIYVIDDITPLRYLDREVLEQEAVLLPTRPAVQAFSPLDVNFSGHGEFRGSDLPEAAPIVYHLRRRHIFGDLRIEILDAAGRVVTTLPAGKRRGLNRVDWPMRLPAPKVPPANALVPAFRGPLVAEGTYAVRLVKGSRTFEGTVEVVADPRTKHSAEDRALQHETVMRLYGMLERMTFVVDDVIALRDAARARADAGGVPRRLAASLEEFADELDAFRRTLVASGKGGIFAGERKLREKLGELYGNVLGYRGRPTDPQLRRADLLGGELDDAVATYGRLLERLEELNPRLEKTGLEPLLPMSEQEWRERAGRP